MSVDKCEEGAQSPPTWAATGAGTDAATARVRARGKFLFVGRKKWLVRGVTYGTFRPDETGSEYHTPAVVERDFAQMAANGVNTVRTYTPPPRWLLDCAQRHGLKVFVGVAWEQHVTFLDEPARAADIERRVREQVRSCARHPAVLAYAVGNEIPAPIVRWSGRRAIERFIRRLYRAAKAEDPDGLVTYVNYPSTEYLCLPFLDFVCFNVFLESRDRLDAYLARLQNLAGDRPLVLAELGLDSRRHGRDRQAHVLDWQVRSVFAAGAAGAFVFSWTDEWYRGGHDIDDWDFGLTDRARTPKPALAAVRRAFQDVPFPSDAPWPRVSVVVCTYNGARFIGDCLAGLRELSYPNYEVIVVDDGSTDDTAAIAAQYGVRLIRTPNCGLSSARNTGMLAATGEIVAYTDDDARPDPHWLTYLAAAFLRSGHVAIGGPNIPPPGDGPIAECVANAPGGPIHVLLSDDEAEHIPGCNMAFRRWALQAIGGFDPRFRVAGDDVDLCWRIQQRGWTIGFCPAAFVWHHRRNSVRTYWRQQRGYGKAEALLERKWPERYNAAGHLSWSGRLYGHRVDEAIARRRGYVYHGPWGGALFQSLYQPAPGVLWSISRMPEWYLLVAGLAAMTALGAHWRPLFFAAIPLVAALGMPITQAWMGATEAVFPSAPRSRLAALRMRTLAAYLNLLQPLARLVGRLEHGLSPWRRSGVRRLVAPYPRTVQIWSEQWAPAERRLEYLETTLRERRSVVLRGGPCSRWDLRVRGGGLASCYGRMAVEEHGAGRQLLRFRLWPRLSKLGIVALLAVGALAAAAGVAGCAWGAATFGTVTVLMALRTYQQGAAAMSAYVRVLQHCARAWDVKERAPADAERQVDREVVREVGHDVGREPLRDGVTTGVGDGDASRDGLTDPAAQPRHRWTEPSVRVAEARFVEAD